MDGIYIEEILMLQQKADEARELSDLHLNRSKRNLQISKVHFAKYVELSAEIGRLQRGH